MSFLMDLRVAVQKIQKSTEAKASDQHKQMPKTPSNFIQRQKLWRRMTTFQRSNVQLKGWFLKQDHQTTHRLLRPLLRA
jgi:GTPase SAR1 family protein